jgi:hypothetical protein
MTATRVVLSGAAAGNRLIAVAAIATPGTTIHTADATSLDGLYLWASNVTTNPVTLTIEWGGTTNPDDRIINAFEIFPNSDPKPVVVGQILSNSLVVKAFASRTKAVNISGFVTRFT